MLKPRTVLPLIPCRTPFKAWVWHFDLVFFFFFNNTKTCVLFASALCCLMQRIILRIIKKTIITKCGIFISNNQIAKVCLSEMRFEFWNNPQPLAQIHWRRFPSITSSATSVHICYVWTVQQDMLALFISPLLLCVTVLLCGSINYYYSDLRLILVLKGVEKTYFH